jgi:hypothetical protein
MKMKNHEFKAQQLQLTTARGWARLLTCFIILATLMTYGVTDPNCNHMTASLVSKPICRACSVFGPLAQHNGVSCSYYTATGPIFCDCRPCLDCFTLTDFPQVLVTIRFFKGGTCGAGLCNGATLDSSWDQLSLLKGVVPCPPSSCQVASAMQQRRSGRA